MPNIKSQKKRVVTSAKQHEANKAVKTELRTEIKKADSALANQAQSSERAAVVANAFSKVDKAAKKGAIHRNNANRKKAALAKKAGQ